MSAGPDPQAILTGFQPQHASFVGVDSDGCVFDTMEAKQKRFFHPRIVECWQLDPVREAVYETAAFVSLYSAWRGSNRFIALLKVFDLLRQRDDVRVAGVCVPDLPELRHWVDSGVPLGNPSLEAAAGSSAELQQVLGWSRDINADIATSLGSIPPFAWAVKALERIREDSDAICVSQTPREALEREWREHGLDGYVSVIAGQELGTKAEHLRLAAHGRYEPEKILMIGDALGDLQAARANEALFYPIEPGREEASWERFCRTAYDRFLQGNYAGGYADELADQFTALLPEEPPWGWS